MGLKVAGDPDQLDRLAATLNDRSRALREVSTRISNAIGRLRQSATEGLGSLGDPETLVRGHSNSLKVLSSDATKGASSLRAADSGTAGTALKSKSTTPALPNSTGKSSNKKVDPMVAMVIDGARIAKTMTPQSVLSSGDLRALAAWWQDRQHHDDTDTLYKTMPRVPGQSLTGLRMLVAALDWKSFSEAEAHVPKGLDEALLLLTRSSAHAMSASELAAALQKRFAIHDAPTREAVTTYVRFHITTANHLLGGMSPGAPDAIGQNGWFLPGLRPAWWAIDIARPYSTVSGGSLGAARAADMARALVSLLDADAKQLPTDYDLELLKFPKIASDLGNVELAIALGLGLLASWAIADVIGTDVFVGALTSAGLGLTEAELLSTYLVVVLEGALSNAASGAATRAIVDILGDKPGADRFDDVLDIGAITHDAFVGGLLAALWHSNAAASQERALERESLEAAGKSTEEIEAQIKKNDRIAANLWKIESNVLPGAPPIVRTVPYFLARWVSPTTSQELNSADIQAQLRDNQPGRYSADKVIGAIARTDTAMSSLPSPTIVYRTTGTEALYGNSAKNLVGKTITENRFLDVTTTPSTLPGDVRWTIEVPAGSSAQRIDADRMLIARKSQLLITSAVTGPDGSLNVHAVVICQFPLVTFDAVKPQPTTMPRGLPIAPIL